MQPNVAPAETPTADCVSFECSYSYEGVAVTCADIEALKENGLNGVPVEWSDGIWSSYWWPSGTEFLIQPLEGLSKEFGFYGKYEHFGDEVQDDGKENSFPIPAECTGLDEPVYVLYTPKADAARLEAALASDRSVTVIGALFCGILQPVNEAGIILDIMPYRAAATTEKIVPFTPKAPAADAAEQYDIAVYAKEHFRRSDGAALHFLDPTRWYAREITKAPDFGNNEGIAYLYADDLGEKYLTGDWSGSLMIAIAYSLFNFDLCGVSEEEAAAFDTLMTDFAASRETLVYLHDAQAPRQLYDYALHTDTAEQLTDALKAQPDVKALISQIQYTPVFVDTVNISTIDGLKFMTPDGDYLSEERLRVLENENDLSWTVNDAGGVSPETVTTESLIELLSIVANADPVILRPSPLAESSYGVQNDDVRVLYQKGDVDGDGKVTAYDATLALTAFSEKTAGYADGERTLTPAQEQIADVDGDGELTAFDATMILTYFNLKYNTGYDDLTWADVLPEG